jgi:hypothetical protein
MSIFGWDLPPGVTTRMIEDSMGSDEAERCPACGRFLKTVNKGACPAPRPCAEALRAAQRAADDATAKAMAADEELARSWREQDVEFERRPLIEAPVTLNDLLSEDSFLNQRR